MTVYLTAWVENCKHLKLYISRIWEIDIEKSQSETDIQVDILYLKFRILNNLNKELAKR